VNLTMLFSPVRYRAAVDAYADGLEARSSTGRSLAELASVASFCVAPIDAQVDRLLEQLAAAGQPAARALRGKSAIASACRIYEIYEDFLASPRWQALLRQGARPQRLAWAGTASDDPGASPVKYVEELIVPDTISTLRIETLESYRRIGRPQLRLERHIAGACDAREGLERLGVDLEAVAEQLELACLGRPLAPLEHRAAWLGGPR
jgi:transaldolase